MFEYHSCNHSGRLINHLASRSNLYSVVFKHLVFFIIFPSISLQNRNLSFIAKKPPKNQNTQNKQKNSSLSASGRVERHLVSYNNLSSWAHSDYVLLEALENSHALQNIMLSILHITSLGAFWRVFFHFHDLEKFLATYSSWAHSPPWALSLMP